MGTGRRSSVAVAAALVAAAAAWLAWPRGGEAPRGGEPASGGAAHDTPVPPGLAAAQPGQQAAAAAAGMASDGPAGARAAPWRFRVVVEETGAPVPGATVSDGADATVLGRTDGEGRLEVGSLSWRRDLFVVVRAAGFAVGSAWTQSREECLVELEPGVEVHGRCLVAPNATPVPGARVTAYVRGVVIQNTVADGEGYYRLAGGARGSNVRLVARTSGRANAEAESVLGTSDNEVNLTFAEGGIVEGTVSDARGAPLPGIPIALVPKSGPPITLHGDSDANDMQPVEGHDPFPSPTLTDDRGRYVIEGAPLGSDLVPAARPTPRRIAFGEPVRFESVGERLRRDILIGDSGTLLVRFTGWVPGQEECFEVGSDRVRIPQRAGRRERADLWRFEGLEPGPSYVWVAVPGRPFSYSRMTVESGRVTEVVVAREESLVVAGQVVTSAGTPIRQAYVWWQSPTASTFIRADDTGRFRFDGLDATPGRLHVMESGDAAGLRLARWNREGVKPGGPPITVALEPSAWLRATVVNADSAMVTAAVQWAQWPKSTDGEMPTESVGERGIRFRVDRLGVPGRVQFRASERAPVVVVVPPLSGGETRDVGVLRFDEGRALDCIVETPNGRAVANAMVNGRKAEQGRVSLPHQSREAVPILVATDGWPRHWFVVPPDASQPVRLTLGPLGTLEVVVVQRDGRPAGIASLRFTLPEGWLIEGVDDEAQFIEKTDAEGRFRGPLQAREYKIEARCFTGNGFRTTESSVTVAPNTETTLTIRLP